jgi:glucan endo-1,3-alpha-glucosidase
LTNRLCFASVNPCASPNDAAPLREFITKYANHPAQFRFNGKIFASTFAGETCTFGAGSTEDGWKQQFTDQLTGVNAATFVPSFFMDPARFKSFQAMDGAFNVSSDHHQSVYALLPWFPM